MLMLHSQGRMNVKKPAQKGFTVVELLIVILVIAILATISTFAFLTIKDKTITTTLKDDLKRGSTAIEAYKSKTGKYPASIASVNDGKGISATNGNTYRYIEAANYQYCLEVTTSDKEFIYSYDSSSDKIYEDSPCS